MPELRHSRPGPDAARGHARRRGRARPSKRGPLIPRRTKGPAPRVLVVGFGNPGRRDDGLGPAAAERLGARRLPGVTCDADYQLNIEDALAVSRHDVIVFVDAARNLRKPYAFKPVKAAAAIPPLSHALGPSAVLAVAAELYDRRPKAWVLAIRGHRWTVGEGLSAKAEGNLALALEFLEKRLREVRS